MDSFSARSTFDLQGKTWTFYRLDALKKAGVAGIERLPYAIRVLLENLLRNEDGKSVKREDILALANWSSKEKSDKEIAFTPARVLLQDFTGVPCVVDLAAMRDAMLKLGADPLKINPLVPVDLVIDHSVMIDRSGSATSLAENTEIEYQRNTERYQFLRWGQRAFRNFRVVPPGTGIVHQVNLEYLASVVFSADKDGAHLAYPDTVVGTDSHTTMINGLGVLGWGVGGIEAEAAMLGQPISMLIPEVLGMRLTGKLAAGLTATDMVLTITELLRKAGVVGKFVEFFGPGLENLPLADRATIANMAPEYGATMGFFPVDEETLKYLRLSGRSEEQVKLVETCLKAQGLFRTKDAPEPEFSKTLELDLGTIVPSLAGPKRPQDRVALTDVPANFRQTIESNSKGSGSAAVGAAAGLTDGAVVIAAITSCTNTSNPQVMLAAGLVAKKARALGLTPKPWVKTSLAPGSRVVTEYLRVSGLLPDLEALGFNVCGYGCTTCIGNSGPLFDEVSAAVKENKLNVAAVLSGNRNFEGRVHSQVRLNYLASPPLVVAYALAGHVGINLSSEPLAADKDGKPVYLKDIWPTPEELATASQCLKSALFSSQYANVFEGDAAWKKIATVEGSTYKWDAVSTYVKHPPYFENISARKESVAPIQNARVLAVLGDSVTTDHISPAGSIAKDGPAARYLLSKGVSTSDFNSFGSRRGNHEVMMRGTFANIRLRNLLAPGTEGGVTLHLPEKAQMSIYDAAMQYQEAGVAQIVIAGKEYGTGSSRDWAGKGPALLGVKAVIAESFERIHRSNLVGMGVLPLEFLPGESRQSLGLTGEELYSLPNLEKSLAPGARLEVTAGDKHFSVRCRIDTPVELSYYRYGGILPFVLLKLAGKA